MAKRIGEILVEQGVITGDELDLALEAQRALPAKRRLGAILMERGTATEDQIQAALAHQEKPAGS